MKLVINYRGEEIPLKTYRNYYELDKELINFESNSELMNKLGLVEDADDIYVRVNKNLITAIDIEAIRRTNSFFELGKKDQFVDWIYSSITDIEGKKNKNLNKTKMIAFFDDRLLDFTKGEGEFSSEDINNAEGKSLYLTIKNTIEQINMFGFRKITKRSEAIDVVGKNRVIEQFRAYVKRDGIYDYVAMRNFAVKLAGYGFKFLDPNIELKEIDKKEQSEILESYKTPIHNYAFKKRQITLDQLTGANDFEEPPVDENGIKSDEKEFLEEFAIKKNLHL